MTILWLNAREGRVRVDGPGIPAFASSVAKNKWLDVVRSTYLEHARGHGKR
ncbi:MAG: hypothetical protein H6597_08545 [Flavobacteriales bacterium]|nr:hypothetical protein [Flavobacteriales bacterium]